jgi:hypothetical protein
MPRVNWKARQILLIAATLLAGVQAIHASESDAIGISANIQQLLRHTCLVDNLRASKLNDKSNYQLNPERRQECCR